MTPPSYKNKKDYKGVTHDKTCDSRTPETSVSRSDNDSYARNLDEQHKNEVHEEYIDSPFIKKMKLILNHMKKSGIGY